MVLTNYLVHITSHNDVIMEIDLEEELNKRVNYGDLDDDGDNARY